MHTAKDFTFLLISATVGDRSKIQCVVGELHVLTATMLIQYYFFALFTLRQHLERRSMTRQVYMKEFLTIVFIKEDKEHVMICDNTRLTTCKFNTICILFLQPEEKSAIPSAGFLPTCNNACQALRTAKRGVVQS